MNVPPEQPVPTPQSGARHSVRAAGNEPMTLTDGGQGTGAPRLTDVDELTGLRGLRTWRDVYLFVFGCFVLWVVLLLALTMSYS
ncbi:MAG TPA: hypothetical protein VMA35_15995 [Candidatus Sulfopaludibacter sp.]|nr:hypothetical protein [Candidatus Sulfopaludibacter sp.]